VLCESWLHGSDARGSILEKQVSGGYEWPPSQMRSVAFSFATRPFRRSLVRNAGSNNTHEESDMPKTKSGSTRTRNGRVYARVTYLDANGKRRFKEKPAVSRTHAKELIKDMLRDLDGYGPQLLDNDQKTFAELADFYEETYLVEPTYVGDRKVAGLRSAYDFRLRLRVLREFFGQRKLRSITHGDLERFKTARLKVPVISGRNTRKTKSKGKPKERQRSIATVNRELSLLRRVFNVAVRNGWIVRNPFDAGDSLIKPGDEKPRERILTREEEEQLLAACVGPRAHIRPIIICALDTGMRRGEILKLTWGDIDFDNRLITVRAFNTKTMRERTVAMTPRLTRELSLLFEQSSKSSSDLVFGITETVKTSFTKAREAAGLADVRFHDLRHTAATRLVQSHISLSEVGRVLGHTQPTTTYRYVNANVETARRAAEALASFSNAGDESEEQFIN